MTAPAVWRALRDPAKWRALRDPAKWRALRDPAKWRALRGPALMSAAMFAILIALGIWQLHRRDWKHALLARIDAAEAAPPVALAPGATPPAFARVTVTGTLEPGRLGRYGSSLGTISGASVLGSQVLAILDRAQSLPLVVSLGWRPDDAPVALPLGPVTIVGYARLPDHPSWLSAHDDPSAHRFYTLDPRAIGQALGVSDPAPYTLVALAPVAPGPDAPVPGTTLPRPPDDHLQYALTWFGLAGVLLVVFALHARRQLLTESGVEPA